MLTRVVYTVSTLRIIVVVTLPEALPLSNQHTALQNLPDGEHSASPLWLKLSLASIIRNRVDKMDNFLILKLVVHIVTAVLWTVVTVTYTMDPQVCLSAHHSLLVRSPDNRSRGGVLWFNLILESLSLWIKRSFRTNWRPQCKDKVSVLNVMSYELRATILHNWKTIIIIINIFLSKHNIFFITVHSPTNALFIKLGFGLKFTLVFT
jgi:hypothetical protein